MIGQLLERWAEAQAARDAIAADPARASELPEAAAACEAAGDAWVRALLFGGTMRERYSASGREGPRASRRNARARFVRALDDALDTYAAAYAAAYAEPDPAARALALVAARAEHERAVAVAYAERLGS